MTSAFVAPTCNCRQKSWHGPRHEMATGNMVAAGTRKLRLPVNVRKHHEDFLHPCDLVQKVGLWSVQALASSANCTAETAQTGRILCSQELRKATLLRLYF